MILGSPLQLTGVVGDHHKQADDAVPFHQHSQNRQTNKKHSYFVLIYSRVVYLLLLLPKKNNEFPLQGSKTFRPQL
jgi:hypothetical protein